MKLLYVDGTAVYTTGYNAGYSTGYSAVNLNGGTLVYVSGYERDNLNRWINDKNLAYTFPVGTPYKWAFVVSGGIYGTGLSTQNRIYYYGPTQISGGAWSHVGVYKVTGGLTIRSNPCGSLFIFAFQ